MSQACKPTWGTRIASWRPVWATYWDPISKQYKKPGNVAQWSGAYLPCTRLCIQPSVPEGKKSRTFSLINQLTIGKNNFLKIYCSHRDWMRSIRKKIKIMQKRFEYIKKYALRYIYSCFVILTKITMSIFKLKKIISVWRKNKD